MPLLPKLNKKYTKILTYFYTITSSLPIALRLDTHYSPNRPGQATLFLFLSICLLTYLSVFDYYFINIVSSYYPLVMSVEAIRTNLQGQRQRWISYWMIYVLTIVLYSPIKLIVGFLPIYQLWRLGFYIFLFHPSFDFAFKIYQSTFKKMFIKKQIERKQKFDKQKYLEKRLGLTPSPNKKV